MIDKTNNTGCCSCDPGCCGSSPENTVDKRLMVIDFLYLDLSVCTRCQGTDSSLDEALAEVSKVLEATGIKVVLNKINVISEELAATYKFISSPTIRINGKDIQMDVKESLCESCGDLCGDEVDCRVWVYQGKEYSVPPKAMIIEAILKEVYGGDKGSHIAEQEYVMPENLKQFYAAMKSKEQEEISISCCGSSGSKSCCE
ncbi:MAG: DUF2703 domain-containing protein [Desulfitobacteriaceae bacterium]